MLVIADAGPLISLACADRLDLLQSFGTPVLVVDVVKAECLRKSGAPGEERLTHWFEVSGGNQFKLIPTPIYTAYEAALQEEETASGRQATRGLGDAAIAWLIPNLDLFRGKEEVALVLTSDAPFGDGPVLAQRHAHVLSTREWLFTLERLEIIASAAEVIAQIEAGGHKVSRYAADRPALLDDGAQSDWKDQTEAEAVPPPAAPEA